jgi:hypothetical protein
MKRSLLILLVASSLCGGCSHYYIRLSNGTLITAHSKPHLDKEGLSYEYKDVNGHLRRVSAGGVTEIGPMSRRSDAQANSQPTR